MLEDDPVLRMLAGRDADRPHRLRNGRVAKNIVGTRRLLNPQEIEARERAHAFDGFVHVPALIGIDHQLVLRADLLAHESHARRVVFR